MALRPPSFPLFVRLGWLVGGQQGSPRIGAQPSLPGEQAQGAPVQRDTHVLRRLT